MATACLTLDGNALYKDGDAEKNRESEIVSLSALAAPDITAVSSMTEDAKVQMVKAALARSENDALRIISPVGLRVQNSVKVFDIYRPIILVLKEHFCKRGGSRSRTRTWKQVCKEHFGISIRRMQQLLAACEAPNKYIRRERSSRAQASSPAITPGSAKIELPKAGDCDALVRNFQLIFGAQMDAALRGLDLDTFELVMSRFLTGVANSYGGKLVGFGYQVEVRNLGNEAKARTS